MNKLSKKLNKTYYKVDKNKKYKFNDAIDILKKNTISSFLESVDVSINLNIDKNKFQNNINNFVILPYNIKKKLRIVVFAQGENAYLAKKCGVDFVGMKDLLELIKKDKIKYDVVIATTDSVKLIQSLGPILGPKGLMPNPKLDTITNNIQNSIKNIKNGKIQYKSDKNGVINNTIGKINFKNYELKENLRFLLSDIQKQKYIKNKGNFLKKVYLSTTMGIAINLVISNII